MRKQPVVHQDLLESEPCSGISDDEREAQPCEIRDAIYDLASRRSPTNSPTARERAPDRPLRPSAEPRQALCPVPPPIPQNLQEGEIPELRWQTSSDPPINFDGMPNDVDFFFVPPTRQEQGVFIDKCLDYARRARAHWHWHDERRNAYGANSAWWARGGGKPEPWTVEQQKACEWERMIHLETDMRACGMPWWVYASSVCCQRKVVPARGETMAQAMQRLARIKSRLLRRLEGVRKDAWQASSNRVANAAQAALDHEHALWLWHSDPANNRPGAEHRQTTPDVDQRRAEDPAQQGTNGASPSLDYRPSRPAATKRKASPELTTTTRAAKRARPSPVGGLVSSSLADTAPPPPSPIQLPQATTAIKPRIKLRLPDPPRPTITLRLTRPRIILRLPSPPEGYRRTRLLTSPRPPTGVRQTGVSRRGPAKASRWGLNRRSLSKHVKAHPPVHKTAATFREAMETWCAAHARGDGTPELGGGTDVTNAHARGEVSRNPQG
jgi:hypothetical protein